jgi:HlyD family secretion protein
MDVETSEGKRPELTEEPARAGSRSQLPVPLAAAKPARRRSRQLAFAVALALLGAAGIGADWWLQRPPGLPPGFASVNGRLEADEIDIATKFAGRVAEIRADEGDRVTAGQVIARMDTQNLEAQKREAQAQVLQAQRALDEARANTARQTSLMTLAKQQLDRTHFLLPKGFATKEQFDQRQEELDAAKAGLAAAEAHAAQAEHALDAARHVVDRIAVDIQDATLVAPRAGRIEYRLANLGEVLPAGGKVFTMLDLGYFYMDVFLPTAEAGRAAMGAKARIVLDAQQDAPIPARVSFVSAEAQFTPKAVETKSERDKLMFRVRVRADLAPGSDRPASLQAGAPGIAYIRLDPATPWPKALEIPAGR